MFHPLRAHVAAESLRAAGRAPRDMSRLSLFETLDGVEAWVRLYGVQPLRDILHDAMLDERTSQLANQWLRQYDANVDLAEAEGLVARGLPPYAAAFASMR